MADIDLTLAVRAESVTRELDRVTARVHRFSEETSRAASNAAAAFDSQAAPAVEKFGEATSRASRFMHQIFGTARLGTASIIGVSSAFAIGTRAVNEYAKANDFAASAMERLKGEASGLTRDIGRDISPLLSEASGVVGALRSARSGAANYVAENPLDVLGPGITGLLFPGARISPRVFNWQRGSSLRPAASGATTDAEQVTFALKAQEEATLRRIGMDAVSVARRESLDGTLAAQGLKLQAVEAQIREAKALAMKIAASQIPGTGPEYQSLRDQFVSAKVAPLAAQRTNILRELATQRFTSLLEEASAGRNAEDRASNLENQIRADRLGVEAQEARLRGVSAEAEKVRVIAEAEEKIRRIRLDTFELPSGADRRLETGVRENLSRQLDAIEQTDLNRRLGEKVERRDRELAAGRALHLEEQMTKAQELRLRGRDREAEQLEISAQFEKRIRDVTDSDFASRSEADRYRGRLRLLMQDQLRLATMLPPDRTASIGSGGYSSGIGRVAFGNGLGPGAAGTTPEAELKKANQTLKQIQQQLERRSGATFN